jgi:1-acyl-sn-glycerol-3-phosphate acyltransferase
LDNKINDIMRKEKNYKFFVGLFNPLFKLMKKYNVIDREALPAENGMIICYNHRDYWDIPIICSIMGTRQVIALVKSELKKQLSGVILNFIGAIFVNRENPENRKRAKTMLMNLVENGSNVSLSPEGTRNKTNAILLPFAGHGAVSIAQKTGKPIITFAISKCGAKGKQRLIRICCPLFISADEDLNEANDRLYNRLYQALLENDKVIGVTTEL